MRSMRENLTDFNKLTKQEKGQAIQAILDKLVADKVSPEDVERLRQIFGQLLGAGSHERGKLSRADRG